jgi:hypothetical protein
MTEVVGFCLIKVPMSSLGRFSPCLSGLFDRLRPRLALNLSYLSTYENPIECFTEDFEFPRD